MSLRSLLRKEAYWTRRNALGVVLVLLIVPGFFAASSLVFAEVVPRDTPVAVAPQDADVVGIEQRMVETGLGAYAEPRSYGSSEAAMEALERESVYAIVEVPHGLVQPGRDVTVRFRVDGSMVLLHAPAESVRSLAEDKLDSTLPANVTLEYAPVGTEQDLSAFVLPIFLVVLVAVFALTYVPYDLAREAAVLDRVRLDASLPALVGAKLVFWTLLILVPILVFQVAVVGVDSAVATVDYDVALFAPGAILALLLTFLTLSAVATAIMLLTRFDTTGRFLNVVVLLAVLGFSGVAFPVGFFSPIRSTIVRAMPTHYATIVVRSSLLKGSSLATFADWLLGLAGVAALSLVVVGVAIVGYRREVV